MAKVDARRIEISGRTPQEHQDIVRALQTDPRGNGTVRLDFERGDFDGWSVRRLARDYSAVIQGDIVRTGQKACRFEIRPGDYVSQGLRAELRDWYNAPFDVDTWYGFSTFLPEHFSPPAGVGVVLAQWHDQAELGDPAGKPPLAIRYLDGALRFTGAFAEVASHDPDRRYAFHEIPEVALGRWLDFVFRIHWSRSGESSIDAFLDGRNLFQFRGPLGYRNQIKGPYFKLGGLCERGDQRAACRLSRQLQPRGQLCSCRSLHRTFASRVAMKRTLAIVSPPGGEKMNPSKKGGFEAVHVLALDVDAVSLQATSTRAVELARQADAEWLVMPGPGEVLSEDALELAEPALGAYDAIFGAAHVAGSGDAVSRLTRLAFDEAHSLPHALLNWWMPTAHIIRTETAAGVLAGMAGGIRRNWWIDYLFDLWEDARCLKSAQPLLELQADPGPLDVEGREHVLSRLMEKPVFLPIVHGDSIYHLPYTGRNAGIEREQSRGLFFEAMELEELRKVVKPGAHVVDVGANTGNHTVFFAGPMKAASVTPFEPLPAAAQALRSAVERNRLTNVDLSFVGVGVAEMEGRAKLVFSGRGGLGATSLAPDPAGEISVASLDSMVSGHVDLLKIDVEGMEMGVLAGSRLLIQRCRPLIFIEVANRNTPALSRWLKDAGYHVMRIFSDKGHANYLLAPGSTG